MRISELLFELNSLKMRFEYDPEAPDLMLISTRMDIIIFYDEVNIFADRIEFWDKPSKCPVKLPYPQNDDQLEHLELRLEWLSTSEGYEYASDNPYKVIEKYPDLDEWIDS
jgi:hypothetical protein